MSSGALFKTQIQLFANSAFKRVPVSNPGNFNSPNSNHFSLPANGPPTPLQQHHDGNSADSSREQQENRTTLSNTDPHERVTAPKCPEVTQNHVISHNPNLLSPPLSDVVMYGSGTKAEPMDHVLQDITHLTFVQAYTQNTSRTGSPTRALSLSEPTRTPSMAAAYSTNATTGTISPSTSPIAASHSLHGAPVISQFQVTEMHSKKSAAPQVTMEVGTPKPVRNTRKRKLSSDSDSSCNSSDDVASVQLDPSELLRITSPKYEDYIKNVTASRHLTANEEREIKRQRRLIKNREAAQNSRQKKREYMLTLKTQVDELRLENNALKMRNHALLSTISQLEEENKMLTQQNQQFSGKQQSPTGPLMCRAWIHPQPPNL